jgi:LDH2 family malate/lactate/ureidoglycolate dehydrogenase
MMSETRRIEYADLERFIREALLAAGAPAHVAEVEAQIAAEVDLCGVHSHGVRMLPGTVKNVQEGAVDAAPELNVLAEYPASVLAEARLGIGRYTSAMAMDMAVERARDCGIGMVTVRGVGHWGRAHSYCLRAARAGVVSLAFTNTIALFSPTVGGDATLGNNPMGIGFPADDPEQSVVLDIAMTQASVGKVAMAAMRGDAADPDWGLDADGNPTTDARQIMESRAFLPMGGHKGSGLSFMIDLLTAGLANGLLCFEQGSEGRPSDSAGGSTKTFIAIRPFGDWLGERADAFKARFTAAGKGARWPGEGSYRRRLDYLERGIELLPPIVEGMEGVGADLDVAIRWRD